MTPTQKLAANRINAQMSTGPKSAEGKAESRSNALRHGVLSSVVLTDGEDPAEYAELLASLRADQRPSGALEEALVEKLALAIWRNRRLAQAESARLSDQLHPSAITQSISDTQGLNWIERSNVSDADAPEPENLTWCRDVVAEFDTAVETTPEEWRQKAPAIRVQYDIDANEPDEGAVFLITMAGDETRFEWLRDLKRYCEKQIAKADAIMERQTLIPRAEKKASLLPIEQQLLIARYQTALDNQMIKTLAALRDAREAQLRTIDVVEADEDVVL